MLAGVGKGHRGVLHGGSGWICDRAIDCARLLRNEQIRQEKQQSSEQIPENAAGWDVYRSLGRGGLGISGGG